MHISSALIDTYQKADELLAEGKLQQAADMCKDMISNNPDFAHGYHLMASLFRSTGNYEKARSFSELAIKLGADTPSFYVQYGQLLCLLGKYEDAETVFLKLIEGQPLNASYMALYANVLIRLARYDEAIALFLKARSSDIASDMADIDEQEGLCMLAMGDMVKAESLFNKAIAACPSCPQNYIHKAKLLLLNRNDREAEICFTRALNCDSNSYEALHGLAVVNERQGQLAAAIAFAMKAVNVNNTIFDSLALLGQLLLRQQSWDAAEHIFRQALTVDPESLYALNGLVQALSPQKKLPEIYADIDARLAGKPKDASLAFIYNSVHGNNVGAPPEEYIAALFDSYAIRYDFYLNQPYTYRPSMLYDMLKELPQIKENTALSFLDLGCGAGDMAEILQDKTRLCVGVDLSQRMLDIARMKQQYHDLHALDITQFAMGSNQKFDLVIAMDVLPYMGNMEEFFQAMRNILSVDSVFAFTFEQHGDLEPFKLSSAGRYSHSRAYIDGLLESQGYDLITSEDMLLRFDYDQRPIKGIAMAVCKMTIH